jgi:hypothetical protein
VRPEPGFYLLGNKILNLYKNIFIVGAFFIDASGLFSNEGIESIEFYLDDKLIGENTEEPFSSYCAFKHFGKGMIKAIAYDQWDYQSEDKIEVWYFKFQCIISM